MKTSNITKSALALALGLCASGAWALTTTNAFETFEGYAENTTVGNLANNKGFNWSAGADAADYTYVNGSGKLVVDTGDSSVTGALSNATAFNNNIANSASFEAKVSFTPATETPTIDGTNLKFALYAKTVNDSTKLCIYNGSETITETTVAANTETTVKVDFAAANTFNVSVGGVAVAGGPFTFANAGGISQVEFQGNGEVDDLGFVYDAPFVLKWSGLTPVSYQIGEGTPVSLENETTPKSILGVSAGQQVKLIVQNADGAQKTITKTAGASAMEIDASSATFGWADYLGEAVNGAYEIDNLAELKLFQKGVAAGLATASTTFKLTADVTLDAAWEGIGIKAGKDLVNGNTKNIPKYEAGAFNGTFDGGNHIISNFQMENSTDYGAFFNSVNGATIMNLKISYKENKLCANSSSTGGDTGATFVGVARNSTLQNLTALATQSVTTVSASKDMAGIVGYLMAGSTVDSCTNELNVASLLTAKARKSGGIALITQDGSGTATIRNCKNSGTVTLANAGGQSGGIVGYVGQSTTIIDCENTAAVKMLTVMDSAALTMQGTNKGNATLLSCNVATNGLNFATVSGNVATFVADNALALNGSYKVMAAGATASYAFAAPGTIAFDQSLATPTYAVTAPGLKLTDNTADGVKTYTAAAYAVVNVTVTGGANATASWTVNDAASAQPTTITEGQSWAVTLTADSGYEFNGSNTTTLSGTAGAVDFAIELPNATAIPPAEYGTTEGKDTAIDIKSGEGSTSHTLTTTEATYLNELVTAKGGTAAAQADIEAAVAQLTEKKFTDAVLLNQDVTDTRNAGSYEFKVSKISKNSSGVTVTVTLTRDGTPRGGIKGQLVLQTSETPNGTYADAAEQTISESSFGTDASPASAKFTFTGSYKFFKVVIR